MFFVLYTACAVPYDTAFSPPVGALRSRFELAVTAIFAVDIALNFFTGRVDKTGSCLLCQTMPVQRGSRLTWRSQASC